MSGLGAALLGSGLFLGWVAVRLRSGGERSALLWRQSTDLYSSKDKVLFFAAPGAALWMISFGIVGLSRETPLEFLEVLMVPLALVGMWMLFIWGIMGFRYPLRLVPAWYRPIEQDRRDTFRRQRQQRAENRHERRAANHHWR